jgi:hypothetical protein
MMSRAPHWWLCLPIALSSLASPAFAKQIASHGTWTAHETDGRNGKACYLFSHPDKKGGDVKGRGDAHVYVTHRPREKVKNEVSITGGYPYKDGSQVDVTIDGKKFSLFTRGPTAWARDGDTDAALVKAMLAGKRMTVGGAASKGGTSNDAYSLSGFTAAYKSIGKACGVN